MNSYAKVTHTPKKKEPKPVIKPCLLCGGTGQVNDLKTGQLRPCVINHIKPGMIKI